MPTYRLSPLAEEYLFKIISTTIESWGSTQARVYAQTIDAALLKLAQYPDFGRERNDVYNGAKSFPVKNILCSTKLVMTVLMLLVFFISAWTHQNISSRIW